MNMNKLLLTAVSLGTVSPLLLLLIRAHLRKRVLMTQPRRRRRANTRLVTLISKSEKKEHEINSPLKNVWNDI